MNFFMKEIANGITVDEKVCHGKPVIAGTRVPVTLVLGQLAGGMTAEQIMEAYELQRGDVAAAIRYAAKTIEDEEILAVS